MNYGSDLDLIFVYSAAGTTSGQIDGKPAEYRAISNHEFYIKVATFLRDSLAASASRDRTYEMDLRLRPEGAKGALAAPVDVFREYFNDRAETWERQALTRSRHVAGCEGFGAQFMELVNEFVYEREAPADLAEQVSYMRGRIEKELSAEDEGIADIKLGRGGIIDIEFLTQYLLIGNGGAHPELRVPNTYLALQTLSEAGFLSGEDAEALLDGYRFLRLVENRLRIGNAQSINIFLKTRHAMNMLARRLNFVDDMDGSANAKLLARFEKCTDRVRRVYEKIVVANK